MSWRPSGIAIRASCRAASSSIALARAVVFRPKLLLMDEPLGALDRSSARRSSSRSCGSAASSATVIYVTHDQEEALVMSDRIAIFSRGRIEQLGNGEDLYDRPVSLFVADFIGESNILRGRYERDEAEGGWVTRDSRRWRSAATRWHGRPSRRSGRSPRRPAGTDADPRAIGGSTAQLNVVDGTVDDVLYLGSDRVRPDAVGRAARRREQRDQDGRAWSEAMRSALHGPSTTACRRRPRGGLSQPRLGRSWRRGTSVVSSVARSIGLAPSFSSSANTASRSSWQKR